MKGKLPPLGTLGPFIALLAACIFFATQSDRFLSGGNFSLILQQVAVVGVIAIGQTLVILTGGRSVTVCAPEYSCVAANAMFMVPSVTMNDGRRMRVTSRPLTSPNSAVTPMPHPIASTGGMPSVVAKRVITMPPSAISMPHDRSMPPVRITSVWPMAITPTTATCCRISEKFSPLKKRSVVAPKTAQAMISAMKGPS